MIQNVKFRNVRCNFQSKIKKDIQTNILAHNKILVAADKSNNFYKLEVDEYNKLLQDNITASYKKVGKENVQRISTEAKAIAQSLQLDDRINIMAERNAFITLKDHKANFANHPTCRLINPAKSNIGKISRQILQRINNNIRKKTNVTQWTNTSSVLEWFKKIDNKSAYTFIEFDIVEFYPSISAELLNQALDFAENYDNIKPNERDIIVHAKNLFYFMATTPGQRNLITTYTT